MGDVIPCIKECWAVMPWEQWGFSCCNPEQQISSAPACQGKGCQLCLCHMKVEPPAAVEKAVDEVVFNWAWMVLYS